MCEGVGGVQAQLTEKFSDNVSYFVLNLQFYRDGPIVYFKENYMVPEGVQHFPGGGVSNSSNEGGPNAIFKGIY